MPFMQTTRNSTKRGYKNANNDLQIKSKKFKREEGVAVNSADHVHINKFPPHIFGLIFTKLSPIERLRAENVCRLWRHLSSNGYGWNEQTKISFDDIYPNKLKLFETRERDSVTNRHVEILLKRCGRHLRVLDLSNQYKEKELSYAICTSLAHVHNLHTLNMSYIQMTNTSLSTIGRYLPKLKKASFRNSFKHTLMERGLSTFFMKCTELEELDLSENELLTGTSFANLPKSLITLNITSCFHVTIEATRGIRNNCANLQNLIMNQLDAAFQAVQLNDMFDALKNLTSLQFSECYGMEFAEGQPSLISLGNLSKLEQIVISDNMLVNNDVLRAISIGCKSLEILNISQSNRHVTDTGLRHLSTIPYLRELRLNGQRALTDDTLMEIVGRGTLKILSVSRCPSISNVSIQHTIKLCKALISLDVSYCIGVTAAIIKELDKSMVARHGKNQPNGNNDDRKFRLAIVRSGIHGNVPKKYSSWIKIVDFHEEIAATSPAFFFAHFLNFPIPINALMG